MIHESLMPFEERVQQGLLSKSEINNLVLYNYTEKCTHERAWDNYTLNSRGTVYNRNTGETIALAFSKFFNLGEHESTLIQNLPIGMPFTVLEKLDGSLGVLFFYNGKWLCSTRGSFYSEQAKTAMDMLRHYNISKWPKEYTPLVEIIYPSNRIIINYGEREELVLLAARHIDSGKYMSWEDLVYHGNNIKMSLPNHFEIKSITELLSKAESLPWQEEGWVIRYDNGLMIKVKGKEYLRLAKAKASMTPLVCWEAAVDNKLESFLSALPEEFRSDADQLCQDLQSRLDYVHNQALAWQTKLDIHLAQGEVIKEMALRISTAPKLLQSWLFGVMRNKQSLKSLYEIIRPYNNKWPEIVELKELHCE